MVDREVRVSAEDCKKGMRRRLLMSNQGWPSSTGQADAQRSEAEKTRPDGRGEGEQARLAQSAECRVQTDEQGLTGPCAGNLLSPQTAYLVVVSAGRSTLGHAVSPSAERRQKRNRRRQICAAKPLAALDWNSRRQGVTRVSRQQGSACLSFSVSRGRANSVCREMCTETSWA